MKTSRKTTVCLALLALASYTAQTETLAGQRTETLGDHLPADATIIGIYAAPGEFLTAVPYYPAQMKSMADGKVIQHIEVKDAALRAETLKRLRAVRIVAPAEGEVPPRVSCVMVGNPFGAWMLGNGTSLVVEPAVSYLRKAKNDEYSFACLQIGDASHWLKLSNADLWRAMKPLVK